MAKSSAAEDTLPDPEPAPQGEATPEPAIHPLQSDADAQATRTQDFGAQTKAVLTSSAERLPYPGWERYRIVSFLGAGGMGMVYKARDPKLHRSVAIKFLLGGQTGALNTRQRRHFDREARAQAHIEHPHICKIYEVGEVEGQPYIAMQFIAGASLASLQQTMGRDEKVRVIQHIAEALHAAHQKNLIHRDIKPANLPIETAPAPTVP